MKPFASNNKEIDIIFDPSKTYTGNLVNKTGEVVKIEKATQPPDLISICFTPNVNDYEANYGVFVLADLTRIQ